MDTIPYSQVRAHLSDTLRSIEARNVAVYISRRGEPAGVLMSVAQYKHLQGLVEGPAAQLVAWRSRFLGDPTSTGPAPAASGAWTDPFADVRDRRPSRPAQWPDDLTAAIAA